MTRDTEVRRSGVTWPEVYPLRVEHVPAGYPWSIRLKALLPLWMPWVRKRFAVSAQVEAQLRRISARQIDRRLRARKQRLKRRLYGGTRPGTLLKHQIAIKTDCWDVRVPGFTEVDLVSHSGNAASGEFAHSLNVTDIHTTWTETRAVLGKGQAGVLEAAPQAQPSNSVEQTRKKDYALIYGTVWGSDNHPVILSDSMI